MDSLLRKEFKGRDVNRIRNLITKNFGKETRVGVGYEKVEEDHREGDIWEADGKKWTIKNGIRRSVSKLDRAKKAIRIPLRCPKCGGPMEHHLAKKMYKIHGFCFDPCTVEYEATLRKAGLYDQYEKRMMQGNMAAFLKDIEGFVFESLSEKDNYVTENGDVEDWQTISKDRKDKILKDLQEYKSTIEGYLK